MSRRTATEHPAPPAGEEPSYHGAPRPGDRLQLCRRAALFWQESLCTQDGIDLGRSNMADGMGQVGFHPSRSPTVSLRNPRRRGGRSAARDRLPSGVPPHDHCVILAISLNIPAAPRRSGSSASARSFAHAIQSLKLRSPTLTSPSSRARFSTSARNMSNLSRCSKSAASSLSLFQRLSSILN